MSSQVKERPILFNGEMIRAILDGKKTQTRGVIKPQLPDEPCKESGKKWGHIDDDFYYCGVKSPYGKVGDRLWVRETFCRCDQSGLGIVYRADGKVCKTCESWKPSIHMPRWASRITLEVVNVRVERVQEITEEDAIAEGLYKEVFDRGTIKEDVFWCPSQRYKFNKEGLAPCWRDPRKTFKALWDSINAKRGFGWDKNPFCWVVTFKVLDK